jgi:DHA1 family bicyclomycin/chloramphenicol resistance-like MFS transporter
VLVAFAVLLLAATALLLPETLPPERRRHSFAHTRADFGTLLRNRGFVGYALAVGLGGSAVISYVSASPFVIQDVYGASTQLYGAIYGAMPVGILIGSQINAHLLRRHSPQRLLGIATTLLLLDAALMLALTAAELPLWAICPTYFLLMFSWGFIPGNAVALAMLDHPERAGTASALVGLCQYGMSAVVVPLIGAAGEGSALPMAAAVFVSSLLCALVLRYMAETHGPQPQPAV